MELLVQAASLRSSKRNAAIRQLAPSSGPGRCRVPRKESTQKVSFEWFFLFFDCQAQQVLERHVAQFHSAQLIARSKK